MKKFSTLIILLVSLIILVGISSLVSAALSDPPSFDNHQFEGSVIWDASRYPGPLNVVARANGKDFVSHIIYPQNCGTKCQGSYGKDVSNILLVQASSGTQIQFYVDNTYVRSYPYAVDGYTVLDLDLSTPNQAPPVQNQPPPVNATSSVNTTASSANTTVKNASNASVSSNQTTCAEDWKCGNWSDCTNGIKLRTCTDLKECNATNYMKNATMACTVSLQQNVTCREDWQCSEWSACSQGQEGRTCFRADNCDVLLATGEADELIPQPKPLEARVCASSNVPVQIPPVEQQPAPPLAQASCSDGLLNQNEEDIDCGGVCESCKNSRMFFYLVPVIILVLVGIILFFVVERGPTLEPEQMQQLYSYFQNSMRQGFNKEQITDNLVQGGWKRKVVKKFIRKSRM